jgi:AcrR family transcriptional regulator
MPSTTLANQIILSTAKIIAEEGLEAATIRNIAKHANVLAPQIYKHVGNIHKLLDDVATHLWETRTRTNKAIDDPVVGLVTAMEELIVFGINNPDIYLHISKLRDGQLRTLWGLQVRELGEAVSTVAKAGLLKVSQKQAVEFILPFCAGMVLTCLHETSRPRDVTWLGWQAVTPLLKKGAVQTMPASESLKADISRKVPNLASELNANLGKVEVLSMKERWLLGEWLERIASS